MSQVVPVDLGGYLASIELGYEPLDEKRKLPNYTQEYLKVLQRPMKPGLIEFVSTVIIGTMGYGKTELAKWIAVKVSKFYGAENVNAIMNRSADLKAVLEAMDARLVQLLFLDDSFGDMDKDIAKQFTLIRHRFQAVLEEAGKPESGVIIALFGIQDIFTLDKLARRVSTATIAKSSSGDKWYTDNLRQTFGEDGIRELDRITRRVTRNYDQAVKGRSVITITGFKKAGYIENEMVDEDLYTEILSPAKEDQASSPRVGEEKRYSYDDLGGFVENMQGYIRSRMPGCGEDCAAIYPMYIEGYSAGRIAEAYPDVGAERTMYRRVGDLGKFLRRGESSRDIGMDIFEPWFRATMRALGHAVTSSESTARGGIDAVVDGVVHSLKCYHHKVNTVSIPPGEISDDEREAARQLGRLVVVLMNPFWGTKPRHLEVTTEALDAGDTITFTPETPEYPQAAAAPASQPHTPSGPGAAASAAEAQTGRGGPGRREEQAKPCPVFCGDELRLPEGARPGGGTGSETKTCETKTGGVETPDPTGPDPVAYFRAMVDVTGPLSPPGP